MEKVREKEQQRYITEQLVTQGEVVLQNVTGKEKSIVIRGKQASCRIELLSAAEQLRVLEEEHWNHEGEKETVRLIRWDVPIGESVNDQKVEIRFCIHEEVTNRTSNICFKS